MDNISYDDFAKLDIKVGTILEALPHPDADKLLILKIDEGKEWLRYFISILTRTYLILMRGLETLC